MGMELRKTGIKVVGDLPWGSHFCSFYETKQDLLDILIPYFKSGLENKEFCLWVISNSELLTAEEATSELRNALPDLDRYVSERSIEVVGHEEWFLSGKTFDPYKVADRFRKKLNEALARGYAGMRVNGSPAWLHDAEPKELHKFEAELDKLFPSERTIASCTYPLATIGADEIFDVVQTHQFAIARRQGKWEVFETPELIQAKQEIKRLNDELEQRVVARTNELKVANEELRKEIAERKQAEEQLRATTEQLRALSARFQSAKEEEAIRIARELHDELGGALTSLKWELEAVDETISESSDQLQVQELRMRMAAMIRLTDTTTNTSRRIASELRPTALDDLGLTEAIEWQALQFQERTGITVQCECTLENLGLSGEQSTAVFRIFQEALTNILRHAQATRVNIQMKVEDGEFILTISDNGRGLTDEEKLGQHTLGLLGMRERAHLIGGEVSITSAKRRGTIITVRLPVANQEAVKKSVPGNLLR
jgi:signal transduction histidine kinase